MGKDKEKKKRKSPNYWTRERCLKEAKKYSCRGDLMRESAGCYNAAKKNKWLDDYAWFVPKRNLWNRETCHEEAKKFRYRTEFRKKSPRAYQVALDNGWLDDYSWFLRPGEVSIKWTEEVCREEAKKYNTRGELKKGNKSCYSVALRKGWLETYDWMKPPKFTDWDTSDNIYIYLFSEQNSVYVGRTITPRDRDLEHRRPKNNDSVFNFSQENNVDIPEMTIIEFGLNPHDGAKRESFWVDHYKNLGFHLINKISAGSLGGLSKGMWTKNRCLEEAKKYKTFAEFNKNAPGARKAAYKNGWITDYTWLIKTKRACWTKEECESEARKYTRYSDFIKNNFSCYNKAIKRGWIKEYIWLERNNVWNAENCLEEARKYTSISEFRNNNPLCYNSVRRKGWLKNYPWLDEK